MADQGAREVAAELESMADRDAWSMASAITRSRLRATATLLREQADTIERHDAETDKLRNGWAERGRRIASLEATIERLTKERDESAPGDAIQWSIVRKRIVLHTRESTYDAVLRVAAERDVAVCALRDVRAACADRQRFVAMGALGWAKAEQIVMAALSAFDEAEARRG